MRIRTQIILLVMVAILLPTLIQLGLTLVQRNRLHCQVEKSVYQSGEDTLRQTVQGMYSLAKTSNDLLQADLDRAAEAQRILVDQKGRLTQDPQTVRWQAVNQLTGQQQTVELPRLMVGKDWLGQIADKKTPVLVVDEVGRLANSLVSIFQRMNDAGDMLRVATNVPTREGHRALGTFIPAVDAQGQPNPVVQTVLRGETYRGRAYVLNSWYLACYEPVKDAKGRVIAILSSAVKQEAVPSLRASFQNFKVGTTGYIWVLGGKGEQQGHYIISKDGASDGKNLWDSKDNNGRLFMKEIIEEVRQKPSGETTIARYQLQLPKESTPHRRLAAVTYFEPWDWVIGATIYEEEFEVGLKEVNATMSWLIWLAIGAGLGTLVLVGSAAIYLGGACVGPCRK